MLTFSRQASRRKKHLLQVLTTCFKEWRAMKQWQELGQGRWKLTITSDDDSEAIPSVYRGTKDEIAELLADSQGHANRRIGEPKGGGMGNGRKPIHFGPVSGAPNPLTPNERMQPVADLQNPATVDK